jgi:hypothetical protein
VVNRDLVPAFVKLLKDTEAEVRSAIAGQIPGTLQQQIDELALRAETNKANGKKLRLHQQSLHGAIPGVATTLAVFLFPFAP